MLLQSGMVYHSMRITLKHAASTARQHGFVIEPADRSFEGYQLWSNERMPGTIESGTLAEVWASLQARLQETDRRLGLAFGLAL